MLPNKTLASFTLATDKDGMVVCEQACVDVVELKKLFDMYAPNYENLEGLLDCIKTANERFNDLMRYMEEHYGEE